MAKPTEWLVGSINELDEPPEVLERLEALMREILDLLRP